MNRCSTAACERALAVKASTFAVLGIHEPIAADGLLEELRPKGHAIDEP